MSGSVRTNQTLKWGNLCVMWHTSLGINCYLHPLIPSPLLLCGCIPFSLCCRSAHNVSVSRSPLNPSRPILFTLAISQGKGLCLLFSLFSKSLFCFPLADSSFIVPSLAPQWRKPGVPFLLSWQSASLRIVLVVQSSRGWSNHMQTWI